MPLPELDLLRCYIGGLEAKTTIIDLEQVAA